MKNLKTFENFSQEFSSSLNEAAPHGVKLPWAQVSKAFRPGYKLGDFSFKEFIEKIPSNGAIFSSSDNSSQLWLEPDYTWNIFNSKGVGTDNGTWNCTQLPGGGTIINLI